jgi:hypothetical protein
MTSLSASTRRSAERATLELPFSVPAKEWFSLAEAATLSGMGQSYVEKKFDEGKELSGHVHNGGKGERMTKRIPRVWLIAWMIRTAHYDDASLGDALIACLRHLAPDVLRRVAAAAARLADAKR